jgi:hypothetical protein
MQEHHPINRKCWIIVGVLACCSIVGNSAAAATEGSWLTGAPLRVALAQKFGVSWVNIPLRQALTELSKSQRLAVMLDRGVDPDQKVQIVVENVPLSQALNQIAARVKIGSTMLGPVAYFGPRATTWRLQTIVAQRKDDVSKLPAAARAIWARSQAWKWADLSTPRDLLTALAAQNNLRIEGLEKIPHDLWATADLPPLDLSDRLTLLLAQFELTFEVTSDGNTIQLVAMSDKPTIERSYPVGGKPQDVLAKLHDLPELADAQLRVDGNKLLARGRLEDLEIISKFLSGNSTQPTHVAEGRKVYTLRADEPVDKLLSAVGRQMGLEIQFDRAAISAAGIALSNKVSLDVKEVSADELLHAILDPAGLTFEHHDKIITVKPK